MSLINWYNNKSLIRPFESLWDGTYHSDFFGHRFMGRQVPPANSKESKSDYNLEIAAPGYKKDDFKIDLDGNTLTISSESKHENEDKDGELSWKEFSYSSFKRSFALPENIDKESISAEYKDGILKLSIPKKEKSTIVEKKKILIA